MNEQQPVPTNWVCKADLISCRPHLEEKITSFDDGDVQIIADKIGDALQETYWLAMGIILDDYLKDDE
jgi:hypothetical protein